MPSARRNRGINSAELCAIAGGCDGGSVRPVSPPSSSSPTFVMRDTKGREYCARHFGNEPTVPLGPRPSLPVPQIPSLLRGESHLHRAIYGCVSSTLLPLPSAPGWPTDRVSIPRRRTLLLDLSSRSRSSRDAPLSARAIIDLRRPLPETTSVKCRGEILINARPE